MQRKQKNPEELRTSQISIRLTNEISSKIDTICKNENKKPAQVGFDACQLYTEIHPALQMIKAIKVNPDMTVSEEELKKKIYDLIKRTL
ncbi:MAG TPA: hypothetical protein O0Y06_00035 [Methanocorpusculum sp.]|nr:hypothetical protein [Methanocorpusculum sp.]HJK79276.1 hypothetical protein [Methanocorpusculum sp.]